MASKGGSGALNSKNPTNPKPGAGDSPSMVDMWMAMAPDNPAYVTQEEMMLIMMHPGDQNEHLEDDGDTSNSCMTATPPPGTMICDSPKVYFVKSWQNKLKPSLCSILFGISDDLGRRLQINSGWRCPAYNRKIGGASNSQHLYGNAADVSTAGYSENLKKQFLQSAMSRGIGGIQIYNSFIHIDISTPRVWKTTPSWARAIYIQNGYPV